MGATPARRAIVGLAAGGPAPVCRGGDGFGGERVTGTAGRWRSPSPGRQRRAGALDRDRAERKRFGL